MESTEIIKNKKLLAVFIKIELIKYSYLRSKIFYKYVSSYENCETVFHHHKRIEYENLF